MITLICAMTTLLIAVGALILAVACRAALDPEDYEMRRHNQSAPPPMIMVPIAGRISQTST
jgi:hypothetical protein